MLQALEVMNGSTLANTLHRGAKRMLGELPPAAENLFDSGACGQQGTDTMFFDIDISQSKRLYLLLEDVDTYDRARLVAGNRVDGPAVINQYDTTTVIPPGLAAVIDRFGNIVIRIEQSADTAAVGATDAATA